MRDEYLFIETPRTALTALTMKKLWKVEADRSYDVFRKRVCSGGDRVLIRTLKGSGRIRLNNGQDFFPSAGSLLVLNDNEIRHYHTLDSLWNFRWFIFSGQAPLPRNTLIGQNLTDAELTLCKELDKRMCHHGEQAAMASSAILAALLHIWGSECQNTFAAGHLRVNKLIEYMHRELKNNLTVSEMARQMRLSERGLCKMFSQATGISPKKYYDQMRMEYARELLRSGLCNVSQVAEQLGYASAFSFSTAFKNAFLHTPCEYIPGNRKQTPHAIKN